MDTLAPLPFDRATAPGTLARPQLGPTPTPLEVDAIITLNEPVLRNLRITLAYHQLKMALTQLLGSKNVNWCGYATWASKTAGVFIRKESISFVIQSYLQSNRALSTLLRPINRVLQQANRHARIDALLIGGILDTVTNEIAQHVAHGNHIVFAELGPLYARMLAGDMNGTMPEPPPLEQILAQLKPGPIAQGGQDLLIKAFTHYYAAMQAHDPQAKAELILLANLMVGYHEQTRLQETIVGAMEAPLTGTLEAALLNDVDRLLRTMLSPRLAHSLGMLLNRRLRALAQLLADDWRVITTRWFMLLELPHERLQLDQDVPPLAPDRMFPPELATPQHPELLALLRNLDRTPNHIQGSAARDWGQLADRMNFVADFFRSRQQTAQLYQQPFTEAQIAAIRANRVPSGPL